MKVNFTIEELKTIKKVIDSHSIQVVNFEKLKHLRDILIKIQEVLDNE